MSRRTNGWIEVARRLFGLGLLVMAGGCGVVTLRQQSAAFYASTVLAGRVECAQPCHGSLQVLALRLSGNAADPPAPDAPTGESVSAQPWAALADAEVAHRVMLHEAGGYELFVPPGTYRVVAFVDLNGDGRLQPGETVGGLAGAPAAAGESGLALLPDLLLDPASGGGSVRLRHAVERAAAGSAAPRWGTQAGLLADLDDARFSAAAGEQGYWSPVASFLEGGGNIYFLEPYDPARIPVLFVHGAAGSAQDWRSFFEHLDRRRYQAWFFQYPSGSEVASMAHLLYWKLLNLQGRWRFEQLHLVAHSMGGLVARNLLVDHGAVLPQIRLLVTLSTPWAGEPRAELGVKHSPAVLPSWRDMQPGGPFLTRLFERALPGELDHVLMFGHRGGYSLLRPNHDGTVTLASELFRPAQEEARRVYGFDEDHVSILSAPAVLARFDTVLREHEAGRLGGPAGRARGRVKVGFQFEARSAAQDFTPSLPERFAPLLLLRPVTSEASGDAAVAAQAGRVPRHATTAGTTAGTASGSATGPNGGSAAASSAAVRWIPLHAQDNGRTLGSIAPGRYDAAVVAAGYRAEPAWVRLEVGEDHPAELQVRLRPQGTLSGYVGAPRTDGAGPGAAGENRPGLAAVPIRVVHLRGPGVDRRLQPQSGPDDLLLTRYVDAQDIALGSSFSFVDLPEGSYTLTIEADGHRPHVSRHSVRPGQVDPARPILLTPLP